MSASALDPGGALSRAFPHYEDRPGQRDMARAVAAALDGEYPLFVEAGTGTGKTLAYLLPALGSQKRVVVSTGTRALQAQIATNDLPLLRRVLTYVVDAAILKGTSNYLCRRKLMDAAVGRLGPALAGVMEWSGRTETGDLAELALDEGDPLRAQISTTAEARLGPRCPHFDRCFVTRARRRADKADLIIVNHHLLCADLALRARSPKGRVLPEYDALIVDEAHQFEDVLTDHFGTDVSTSAFEIFDRDVRAFTARVARAEGKPSGETVGDRLADAAQRGAQQFFRDLRAALEPLARRAEGDRFEVPGDLFGAGLRDRWLAVDATLDELAAHMQLRSEASEGDESEIAASLWDRAHGLRDALAVVAEARESLDYVYWGQLTASKVRLKASPVDIAPIVEREIVGRVRSVVFTSATLTAAGSFAHMRRRFGLERDGDAEELAVESPFDFERQCMMYIARDLPDPRQDGAALATAERAAELLSITEGRAFFLFTSFRALRATAAYLADRCDYPLLVQGQMPRDRLQETFENTDGAVLCATGTFWEGIDVPGAALSQVLIDKLPFAVPSDPLVAARMRRAEEHGQNAFDDYQVPLAALSLRQGFGRLIRRATDRGILSVLDPRIVTKRYGQAFLSSVPKMPRTSAIEPLRKWWHSHA